MIDEDRLTKIEQLIEELRAERSEIGPLEQRLAAKRATVGRLEAELAGLTGRPKRHPTPSPNRVAHGERRDQILKLVNEGLDGRQIMARTGLPTHIVHATLRRLRESGRIPGGPGNKN